MFDCLALCRRAGSRDLDVGAREARNCTLVHPSATPDERWQSAELVHIHMGRPTRWDREGQDRDFYRPAEDAAGEGCPGGWYRSGFVASIHPYRRQREEGGGRTDNPRLARCTDPLVIEAVDYLEHEEAHALGAFYEARDADG
ncbi:MAG: hypothetical protein JNL82_29895 [Myxococcales bacterium]|nr:hypothetical protein [Myxococcales bacterium]